jgi:hypothetical protein
MRNGRFGDKKKKERIRMMQEKINRGVMKDTH